MLRELPEISRAEVYLPEWPVGTNQKIQDVYHEYLRQREQAEKTVRNYTPISHTEPFYGATNETTRGTRASAAPARAGGADASGARPSQDLAPEASPGVDQNMCCTQ